MKLDFKVILLGGVAFYIAQFIVSFATGPLIHDGVLMETYRATTSFWRPELAKEPPDMAALLPRWITVGLIAAFILTGIYDNLRGALNGAPWLKGLKYGLILFLVTLCWSAGWSGIFNLPETIWIWWSVESLAYFAIGGAVLGFVTAKLSPG